MEYLSKENVSLLDTVDDVSVWTPADIKVCVYTCYLQENICDNEGIILNFKLLFWRTSSPSSILLSLGGTT